jgi:class 3 adenylate cyclase
MSFNTGVDTRSCDACGAQFGPTARFCSQCGTPTNQATRAAEYKQVTVLFADVVHSMDIAAAVGSERLREIMADVADRCAAAVQRYGGTVDKFTGDGIMAVFGAPIALEDHAIRACRAALGILEEIKRLAIQVRARDDVDLQLRVGLNSGQVIAGEIGSGSLGYTTIGDQVGMAQRMESVAPPDTAMLSESTARLVEDAMTIGAPELVHIKGTDKPVAAHLLLGLMREHVGGGRAESNLVGRQWEMAAVEGLLERAVDSHGVVVTVVGIPGIGKSRLVREVAAIAAVRGVEVFSTFCESHASDIPFRVIARLLRAVTGIGDLDGSAARAQVRAQARHVDPEDLLLFDDLLGIADPDVALPKIDPDARRRRLTALINAGLLTRQTPAVYVVEDVHWIDEVSESMLTDFVAVIPQTHAMVLLTFRPEYHGTLLHAPGAQGIALAPLSDRETSSLVGELLGGDPSVGEIAELITGRAAGNPFFAQEIIRELAERGVLVGERGSYTCRARVAEFGVPATLQATVAARIDRLPAAAKQTLTAAAVIGSRFSRDLLTGLGIEPHVDELIGAELIDQVRFTPYAEYVFHHPLIRSVAYESQLKADRAQTHRRLAAAIEAREPGAADQNAALIAEHVEAAGDLHASYGWHMRAATWATNRDISSARQSWKRAQQIADALSVDDPNRAAMRIAPRTMLCGTAWQVHENVADDRFNELRELCDAAGDKASLAIAMVGLVAELAFKDRMREASQLASEAMALIESVGDPTLTVGLSGVPIYAKTGNAEYWDVLRWSQRVIDLADGDPSKGNFLVGSPLAVALAQRADARYSLGLPGWRDDLEQALAMARSADPLSYTTVVTYVYCGGIAGGVLVADDRAVRESEDALRIAERSGDDFALASARMTLGLALVHRQSAAERDGGQQLLAEVREMFLGWQLHLCELPTVNVYLAREWFRCGDRNQAIQLMRTAADDLFREGRLLGWGMTATGVLVGALLERAADGDVSEAEAAIERLAAAPADDGGAAREIWLLRLRALLAQARGDAAAYTDFRDSYREMAKTLGYEGHMAWAEAMP